MHPRLSLTAAVFVLPVLTPAQTPDPPQSFDVVSIKPTVSAPVNSGFRRATPGSLNATNVSVRFLLQFAYDVREDQVIGGPGWLDTARFEIVARPPEGSAPAEAAKLVRLRTQNLLADCFHLVMHRDTKEMPVFVLTVARNGPKGLKPAAAPKQDYVDNGHHLDCQGVSMALFAKGFLANHTAHSVTDKTGIAGNFDFTLDWLPDDAPPTTDSPFPPLFAALQEQLGLRLDQQKDTVEVLIVDHAERPSEN